MSIPLGKIQRSVIAEKLMELANLSVVALVLAQLLNSQIDLRALGVGFIVFLSGYLFGFRIMKGGAN